MCQLLRLHFLLGSRGVTALEYGIIAGLIAIAIVAAVTLIGTSLSSTFQTIAADV